MAILYASYRTNKPLSLSIAAVLVILFVLSQNCVSLKYDTIQVTDNRLPRNDSRYAVGYDQKNDTILLFGGYMTNRQQFTSFKDNIFTDHGTNYLPRQVGNSAQSYTQINQYLYMMEYLSSNMLKFDTETRNVTYPALPYNIPTVVGYYACLAHIDNGNNKYLFVVGGYDYSQLLQLLQIFNLSSGLWIDQQSIPNMKQQRAGSGCIVHKDILYVMGGTTSNSIETLFVGDDLIDIQSQEWQYINGTIGGVSVMSELSGVVINGDDILVIGGEQGASDVNKNPNITVIDTVTNNVYVGGILDRPISNGAAIITNNVLYIFGGKKCGACASNVIDTYQYVDLVTSDPTTEPTMNPSDNPTKQPTTVPTNNPTTYTPTTVIPTTAVPTTMAPTTNNPTTNNPTTHSPTTSVPTTTSPTTSIPTTYNPTTNQPTTSIPTTSLPTTAIPTTIVPTTNNPTTSSPTTSVPTTTSPTTNNPTTFSPTTNTPTTSNPTAVPTTSIPTTTNPTPIIPTTTNPTTMVPTTNNPTTTNPTTFTPTTSDPTTYPPTTFNPTTSMPTTFNPTPSPTSNPTTTTPSEGGSGHVGPSTTNDKGEQNIDENTLSFLETNLLVVILCAVGFIICCITCLIITYFKKKKNHKKEQDILKNTGDTMELARIGSTSEVIATNDTTTTLVTSEPDTENQPFSHQNALKMWLNNIGLIEYFDIFIENGFNDGTAELLDLTNQDLKDMGINKVRHRKLILKQIDGNKQEIEMLALNKGELDEGENVIIINSDDASSENGADELFEKPINGHGTTTTGGYVHDNDLYQTNGDDDLYHDESVKPLVTSDGIIDNDDDDDVDAMYDGQHRIETKRGNNGNDRFYALGVGQYIGMNDDQLNVEVNDIFYILKTLGSGWWFGYDENGNDGWIPSNYLKKCSVEQQKELKEKQKQQTNIGDLIGVSSEKYLNIKLPSKVNE